jgi:uncharacterized membrane protein
MATVTVLRFSTAEGAEEAMRAIQGLQKQHLVRLHDGAVVSWPAGRRSPRARQLVNLAGIGAMNGMLWGMLFGLVFFVPLYGMAAGAGSGALGGAFRDYGIDDDFVKRVRSSVTEGTSALFLLTSDAAVERVVEAMKSTRVELIATSLSSEQEQVLRSAFRQGPERSEVLF